MPGNQVPVIAIHKAVWQKVDAVDIQRGAGHRSQFDALCFSYVCDLAGLCVQAGPLGVTRMVCSWL